MRLTGSSLCRRCGAEEKNSFHFLCECEALASLRHALLVSFSLDPEDVRSLIMGAFRNLSKAKGFPQTGIRLWGTKGPLLRPRCIGTVRARTSSLINQSINRLNKLTGTILMFSQTNQNFRTKWK